MFTPASLAGAILGAAKKKNPKQVKSDQFTSHQSFVVAFFQIVY